MGDKEAFAVSKAMVIVMSEQDPRDREMRERLEVLTDFFSRFKGRYGAAIHFKDFTGYLLSHPLLGELTGCYLFHEDPFCAYIKENTDANEKCVITSNDMLMSKLIKNHRARDAKPFRPGFDEGFYGVCWCGLREYVYPVCHSGVVVGALLAGPFRAGARDIAHTFDRLCSRWNFSRDRLNTLYDETACDAAGFELNIAIMAKYLSMLAEYYVDRSLITAFKEACRGDTKRRKLISLAIEYISMNLSSKITVADMAVYCMCSKSTLNHLFSGAMGRTIPEFVALQRVDRAKYLLANTEQSVEQIALQCGFSSSTYFSVVFRKLTDFTPSEFRGKINGRMRDDITALL